MDDIITYLNDDLFPKDSTVTSFFLRSLALHVYITHITKHQNRIYDDDGPISRLILGCNTTVKDILNEPSQHFWEFNFSDDRVMDELCELKDQEIITWAKSRKNGSRYKQKYFSLRNLTKVEKMWDAGLLVNFNLTLDKLVWRYKQLTEEKKKKMKMVLKTKSPWIDARAMNTNNNLGNYLQIKNGSNTVNNLIAIGLNTGPKIREFYYELRNLYYIVIGIMRRLHPVERSIKPTIIEEHKSIHGEFKS